MRGIAGIAARLFLALTLAGVTIVGSKPTPARAGGLFWAVIFVVLVVGGWTLAKR